MSGTSSIAQFSMPLSAFYIYFFSMFLHQNTCLAVLILKKVQCVNHFLLKLYLVWKETLHAGMAVNV